MLKRNQMRYLYLADNNWRYVKEQPSSELATRRLVNLSVKIPDAPATGLGETDSCVYVRTIIKSNTAAKGHFIAPRCREIPMEEISLDEYFINLVVF
jgi:hypothetical protein